MKLLILLSLLIVPFPKTFVQKESVCEERTTKVHMSRRLGPEDYIIDARRRRVIIKAGGAAGEFYARQTIGQLKAENNGILPRVHISDSPRFPHRGVELDCSRHFYSVAEVRKILDVMAMYKLNRFHWHLTDDHGWRVEIQKYPLLTEIGAYRNGTMVGWDFYSNDGIRYGGYYTQEELRDIVAYAKERHIEIIPEIDLPAHMVSALKAYPYLGCTGGPYELMTVWDIAKDVLCAGKESSYEFLEDVLGEICDIFPYEYIHIGGDECPKTRWKECPFCQARIDSLGIEDTEEATAEQYLQNYVTSRVQDYLQSRGKKVIGWDEILEGDLKPGATIMSWRGTEGGITAANKGFDVIMTPCQYCYLDYCQGSDPEKEPISIGHHLPVDTVYAYNPTDGMEDSVIHHILGLQGNLWTEFIAEEWHLEYMLLPRMLAIAEVAWTEQERKDFDRFRNDVIKTHIPRLEALGYTVCHNMEM